MITAYVVGAVAKWLERQTADTEVPGSSPNHGMEELSRSSFNHCFTPPRCNGYLTLGNLSDGAGMSSEAPAVNPMFKAEYSLGSWESLWIGLPRM